MKKDNEEVGEMREHYDFSKGVRGKYASHFAEGSNLVILAPDVAEAFPDSESVNAALRMLMQVAQRSVERTPAKFQE
jgi:hypothetical protein